MNPGNLGCRDAEEVRGHFPLMSCIDTGSKKNWDEKRRGHTGAEDMAAAFVSHVYRNAKRGNRKLFTNGCIKITHW